MNRDASEQFLARARSLLAAGDFAGALEKAEKAERLHPSEEGRGSGH